MTHMEGCVALDPFAHLLGDYAICTCGAAPCVEWQSTLGERMSRHAEEVKEWLNMVRGPRHVEAVTVGHDDGDYPL